MSRRIFDKHEGTAKSEQAPRTPVAPLVDETFHSLTRELSGLGEMEVSRAAKERGWASLQRELERRPIRAAASPAKTVSRVRSWRWALASAGAAVAVIAGVLGAYGGGAFNNPVVVDNGHPTTVTSVATSDTTQPDTTGTTITTTTGSQPSSTDTVVNPGTTGTQPTSPSTSDPGTSQPTNSTARPTTSTTQSSPSTTTETEMASKERVESAGQAVYNLGLFIISDDISGARALVDPQTQGDLVSMIASLNDPNGFHVEDKELISVDTVRMTLIFQDRVDNGQGVVVEKTLRFSIKVHVTAKGAVVTAINAG